MHVLKFGGSILRSAEDFMAMAEILRQRTSSPCLVIVSALSNSTRELDACCTLAIDSAERAEQRCDDLLRRTQSWSEALLHSVDSKQTFARYVEQSRAEILQLLRGIAITKQLTPRIRDKVLAFGEHIASVLIGLYLGDQGITTQTVNAEEIIVTDGTHGAARPLRRESHYNSARLLLPILDSGKIVIMAGFIARSEGGHTTTMGRESSNLSAALMAQLLHAEELTVYTDVEGLRSADPSVVNNARLIPQLSYAQAYTLAAAGLKLLYPSMIEPLRAANITMNVRHLRNPDGPSTRIDADHSARSLGVALRIPAVSVIHMQARSLTAAQGLRTEAIRCATELAGLHHLSSGSSALSVCIDPESCSALISRLPDDVSSTRHDGVDCIVLIHTPDLPLQRLASTVATHEPSEDILRCSWMETEHTSVVICRSDSAESLYRNLHSILLQT